MFSRPLAWLVGLVSLAVLAAVGLISQTDSLENRLAGGVSAALSPVNIGQLRVTVDGRDVHLSGEIIKEDAVAQARRRALAVKGVRTVDVAGLKLAALVDLPAPVVDPLLTNDAGAAITGRWAEGTARTLAVTVAGRRYVFGRDRQLTSRGDGNWRLKPAAPLSEGVHDVSVEISDGKRSFARDETTGEIVIDLTPPSPPRVTDVGGVPNNVVISGAYDAKETASLAVSVAGKTYTSGIDEELSAAADGTWTLRLGNRLGDGVHPVAVTARDKAGNTAAAKAARALIIDTTPPPAPLVQDVTGQPGDFSIEGTFDGADTARLAISVAGRTYVSPGDSALARATATGWRLKIREKLADGVYDIKATAYDRAGNGASSLADGALTVTTPKPPEPAPEPEPVVKMRPPSVSASTVRGGKVMAEGSWHEDVARSLSVQLNDKVFVLGRDREVSRAGKNRWRLEAPAPDGSYKVGVMAAGPGGETMSAAAAQAVVVDTRSPAQPSVRPQAARRPVSVIEGTWPAGDARQLEVSVAGRAFALGRDKALVGNGDGTWRLDLPTPLKEGVYDVVVVVRDAAGNGSSDASKNEIVVRRPRPEPVAKPALAKKVVKRELPKESMNCQKAFEDLLGHAQVRFEPASAAIAAESQPFIARLAKVARTCRKAHIEVRGHTDSQGSATYNKALSERRAAAVVEALARQGIARNRLSAVGYGETAPIAGNDSEEGRARNRRIELFVKN